MNAALELSDRVGKTVACRALGVPRASPYRRMQPSAPRRVRPTPARALDASERQTVLDHGGDMWADTNGSSGARFCLRL